MKLEKRNRSGLFQNCTKVRSCSRSHCFTWKDWWREIMLNSRNKILIVLKSRIVFNFLKRPVFLLWNTKDVLINIPQKKVSPFKFSWFWDEARVLVRISGADETLQHLCELFPVSVSLWISISQSLFRVCPPRSCGSGRCRSCSGWCSAFPLARTGVWGGPDLRNG